MTLSKKWSNFNFQKRVLQKKGACCEVYPPIPFPVCDCGINIGQGPDCVCELTFIDINLIANNFINLGIPADIYDVNNWNNAYFFAFDSVIIQGNTAIFRGSVQSSITGAFDYTIGFDDNLLSVYDYGGYFTGAIMDNCYALKDAHLPCVQVISFINTISLENVYAPLVTIIGDSGTFISVFGGCGPATINLASVVTIYGNSFANSGAITLNAPSLIDIQSNAAFSDSGIVEINAPNLQFVGFAAFQNCNNLVNINFPNCIIISTQAFWQCDNLSTVNIPACTDIVTVGGGFNFAFGSCPKLSLINMQAMQNLGGSPLGNGVFLGTTLTQPLIINVNISQQTINAGSPD